ncbi:2759_t:CDS:2 [Ambispora gerdemannii]|uniref:2759_t:CDS:1 n=1 Tax=Ambispora gerdemannii TaxID=144530 RepID=A0A9N9C7L3_9GLOM|nr:2759_t:CDS:2 [Ambispora gerdemannii]
MNKIKFELTEEQKKCVEYPLNEQMLLIDADPGTGDPKQNIMAFAGATEDVFQLLKEKFPDCVQMEISISFRVPQEIAVMANDFTRKFMPHKPKLRTNQTNGGKKPAVFLAGQAKDYQLLTAQEENGIKEKIRANFAENNYSELPVATQEKKSQKLQKKWTDKQIKTKKLKSQIEFILEKIEQLDKSASRFIMAGDNQNRVIKHLINKIHNELKSPLFPPHKFNSLENFLSSLGINWHNIPKFQLIMEKFDQERMLNEEKENQNLSVEEINDFIWQIDKQLIERDLENAGKTVLSTIHKAKGLEFDYVFLIAVDEEILPKLYITASCPEECSRYLRSLSPNLIELIPANSQLLPPEEKKNHSTSTYASVSEMIGEKGEEEVWQLLANNKKIKFERLIKNWREIEDLQVDIYGETAQNIYFIEVKN